MVAYTEVVDKTCACGEVVIAAVVPSVTTSVSCPAGNSLPVVACTCIDDAVVYTVSTIATPPVGEVQHCLKVSSEFVTLVLSIINISVTEIAIVTYATVIAEALYLSEIETGTKTYDG